MRQTSEPVKVTESTLGVSISVSTVKVSVSVAVLPAGSVAEIVAVAS